MRLCRQDRGKICRRGAHRHFVNTPTRFNSPAAPRNVDEELVDDHENTDHPAAIQKALDSSLQLIFNNHDASAIARVIENFTPKMSRELWRHVGDFTRQAVTDFAPVHGREAQLIMSAVARLVAWSVEHGALELDRAGIFNGYNIEQYISDSDNPLSSYGAENARRQLMRVSESLGTVELSRVRSRPNKRPAVMSPYTGPELARFRAMSATRSNTTRRHNWAVFVALTAGCGLSTNELLQVRRANVHDTGTGVSVHVAGRIVTCTARFEDDLRTVVASDIGGEYLWTGDDLKRPNPPQGGSTVSYRMRKYARPEVAPIAGRMRATWIVNHLNNGIHLNVLTQALGVTSLRPLEGYLPYLTSRTPEQAATSLRSEVVA